MYQSVGQQDRFIPITFHSGVIASVLRNLNNPRIDNLQTGNVVCAIVQLDVEKLKK